MPHVSTGSSHLSLWRMNERNVKRVQRPTGFSPKLEQVKGEDDEALRGFAVEERLRVATERECSVMPVATLRRAEVYSSCLLPTHVGYLSCTTSMERGQGRHALG